MAASKDTTLCGFAECDYERLAASFARHARPPVGLFIDAPDSLAAGAREFLGDGFSQRKFDWMAARAWERWSKISLSTFELIVAAANSEATLDGLRYAGLVVTLLFPHRESVLTTAAMDDLLAASSAEDTPPETLEEMQVAVRAWGDRGRRGFLRREDFLRVTEELEVMTEALKAELLGEVGPASSTSAPASASAATGPAAAAGAGAGSGKDGAAGSGGR